MSWLSDTVNLALFQPIHNWLLQSSSRHDHRHHPWCITCCCCCWVCMRISFLCGATWMGVYMCCIARAKGGWWYCWWKQATWFAGVKGSQAMQHKKEDCPSRLKSVFFWHHQYPLALFRLSFSSLLLLLLVNRPETAHSYSISYLYAKNPVVCMQQ